MTKIFALIAGIKALIDAIPASCKNDVVDGVLDVIEKIGTEKENNILLVGCGFARKILNVPDEPEEVDQTNPV